MDSGLPGFCPWNSPGKNTICVCRLPLPSPGDLPHLGIEPGSPALQAVSLPSEPLGKPRVGFYLRKIKSIVKKKLSETH